MKTLSSASNTTSASAAVVNLEFVGLAGALNLQPKQALW
jgi:hypothetical protein